MRQSVKNILFIGAVFFTFLPAASQPKDPDSIIVTKGIIRGNDTIPLIELEEVRIYKRQDFEYLYQKRRNRRLVRNVKKAYPYAMVAGERLRELDRQLAGLDTKDMQKEYVNKAEKEIMDEFEKEVSKWDSTSLWPPEFTIDWENKP